MKEMHYAGRIFFTKIGQFLSFSLIFAVSRFFLVFLVLLLKKLRFLQ